MPSVKVLTSKRTFTRVLRQSPSRLGETPLGVLEHCIHLLARHAVEPLEEVLHAGAALEVFEESADGDARALEQPHAADLAGDIHLAVTPHPR